MNSSSSADCISPSRMRQRPKAQVSATCAFWKRVCVWTRSFLMWCRWAEWGVNHSVIQKFLSPISDDGQVAGARAAGEVEHAALHLQGRHVLGAEVLHEIGVGPP